MSVAVVPGNEDSNPPGRERFRRLDHVGIAVWDADLSIPYYRDTLGLELVGDEIATEPGSRLVYFKAGESFIQLVEPLPENVELLQWLTDNGEGFHHICLAVKDLDTAVRASERPEDVSIFRAGRRRNACFLNGVVPPNVRIEVTELHPSSPRPASSEEK